MKRKLTLFELETIINFNAGEDTAYIFTYDKTWQKHLEKKLGLKGWDNGSGGREYEISKKRIKPPRAIKRLSIKAKKELVKRLAVARQNATESGRNPRFVGVPEGNS